MFVYSNSLFPGSVYWNFKEIRLLLWLMAGVSLVELPSDEYHRTLLMMSTLVLVMARWLQAGLTWCPQATSHYLSQCWPSTMSPYWITRPQRVNEFSHMYLLLLLWHQGNPEQYESHISRSPRMMTVNWQHRTWKKSLQANVGSSNGKISVIKTTLGFQCINQIKNKDHSGYGRS